MRHSTRFILLALLFSLASPGYAVLPESGIYWNPGQPGRGYVIAHQNAMVFVLIFAYDHDSGAPKWYTAQGPLFESGGWHSPPLGMRGEGFYPAHEMRRRLAEVSGGACLYCLHRDTETTREIADIAIHFDFMKHPTLELIPDNPDELPGSDLPPGPPIRALERFDFGRVAFGHEELQFHHMRTSDLAGEWLFSDRADPAATPWRLVLSHAEFQSLMPSNRAYTVRFVDPMRNAEVVCKVGHGLLLPPGSPLLDSLPWDGCEFMIDGIVNFSAQRFDIGPARIEAFRGTLPPNGDGPMRREQRVAGVRVE